MILSKKETVPKLTKMSHKKKKEKKKKRVGFPFFSSFFEETSFSAVSVLEMQ